MGFFACFIAYPFIYKKIVGDRTTRGRILQGALAAAILSVVMGACAVVLETLFSGISELPFFTFILLMLPIHLAIGVVEGLITAAVVTFVWKARPEILEMAPPAGASGAGRSFKPVIIGLVAVAVFTGGLLSWFASTHPDGLEWSIKGVTGKEEVQAPKTGAHGALASLQEKLAFLPDYDFRKPEGEPEAKKEESWPDVNPGKSLAGVLGAAITLLLAGAIGFGLKKYAARHG